MNARKITVVDFEKMLVISRSPVFLKFFDQEIFATRFRDLGQIKVTQAFQFQKKENEEGREDDNEGKFSRFIYRRNETDGSFSYDVGNLKGLGHARIVFDSHDEIRPTETMEAFYPNFRGCYIYSISLYPGNLRKCEEALRKSRLYLGHFVAVSFDIYHFFKRMTESVFTKPYLVRADFVNYHDSKFAKTPFDKKDSFSYQAEYRFLFSERLSNDPYVLINLGKLDFALFELTE